MSVRPHPTKAKKEPGFQWQIDIGRGKNRKRIAYRGTRCAAEAFESQIRKGHISDIGNDGDLDLPSLPLSSVSGPAVYFIQQGLTGPIKIGYTAQSIGCRLRTLQIANPDRLRLVGFIVGADVDREAQEHHKFREFRIGGEWFFPARELTEYIKRVSLSDRVQQIKKSYDALVHYVGHDSQINISEVVDLLKDDNIEELKKMLS